MEASLQAKLNLINAVEALIEIDGTVRLKLPGVYWQGWANAPRYADNPTDLQAAADWNEVHAAVSEWLLKTINTQEDAEAVAGGYLYIPSQVSLEELEGQRDDLADTLLIETDLDESYKAEFAAFEAAHEKLIAQREGVKELRKIREAIVRTTAIRLFAQNGDDQKKLSEGVGVEYFTEVQPYDPALALAWALEHADWLLSLDAKLVKDFVLAQANQKPLGARLKQAGCPFLPETRVRPEIGWKELDAQAKLRARMDDTEAAER